MAELVRSREAAKDDPVADMHMAGQRSVVRHNGFVTDNTVVGDVHVGHNPVLVADNRLALVLRGAAADRAEFANRISVPYP